MRRAVLGVLLGLAACDDEPGAAPLPPCEPPGVRAADQSCTPAGIAPDGCAEGFAHDGVDACVPILPEEPCPPGLMGVPGETECRSIMDCGEGTWGDIPVDDDTVHVDAAYEGGDGDGSSERPFTTITEALAAADPGGLVAVAAGSYQENVAIAATSVELWGRCPELCEIVGDEMFAATLALSGASGTELHGLALRGVGTGLEISDTIDLTIDRLWIHDAARRGIELNALSGPVSVLMTGSLVEANVDVGIHLGGAVLTVEASVVRNNLPDAGGFGGRGIGLQPPCSLQGGCNFARPASLTLRGSVVEGNRDVGVFVAASDATVAASVVRGTLPLALDQRAGIGMAVQPVCLDGCDTSHRPSATITGSYFEGNHESGLHLAAADATVERTVLTSTIGRGIAIMGECAGGVCDAAGRAVVSLRHVVVAGSLDVGIFGTAADVTIDSSVVRDTAAGPASDESGRGINLQLGCVDGCDPSAPAIATLRGVLVERSHQHGIAVLGSEADVSDTVVDHTSTGDGLIASVVSGGPTRAFLSRARVADIARAGISTFGATLSLADSTIRCAAFDIDAEPHQGIAPLLDDAGGNSCGCPDADGPCKAVSAELEPPAPIEEP